MLAGDIVAVGVDGGGRVGVGALGGLGVGHCDRGLVVAVGGGGQGGQCGGFVGARVQVEQLDAVDVGGDGGDCATVLIVEGFKGCRRGAVHRGGAGRAGGGKEVDFGVELV